MMKRIFFCIAAFIAAVSCSELDEVEDMESSHRELSFSITENKLFMTKSDGSTRHGADSLFMVTCREIAPSAAAPSTRTSVVTGQNLKGFYLNVTSGNQEIPVAENVFFSNNDGSLYTGGLLWPATDCGYHFYASNVKLLNPDCRMVECSAGKDIIWASLASPGYRQTNNLSFSHLYARIGELTLNAPHGMRATLKSAVIYASSEGVFDMNKAAWHSVSEKKEIRLDASNDVWVIPGSCEISITYDITNGTMLQQNLVRSGSAEFTGNAVNNITANVGYDDYIVSYGNPYGLSVSCSDIPASGGTVTSATVLGICRQKAYYASGKEEEIVVDDYSVQWSPAVTIPSLSSEVKARSKVGTISLTYTANGRPTVAVADIFQAENRIESTSYGEWTFAEKQYGETVYGPKTFGSVSYGEKSYGEWSYGEKQYGPEYAGTATFGAEYLANTTTGAEYKADKSYGSEYYGDKSYGAFVYGAWTEGGVNYGSPTGETRGHTASISADRTVVPASGGTLTLYWSASHESRTTTPYTVSVSRTVSKPWTIPVYRDWTQAVYRDDVKHYVRNVVTPYYRDYTRTMTRNWTRSTSTPWTRGGTTAWTRVKSRVRTDVYTSGKSVHSDESSSESGSDSFSDSGTDTGTDSGIDTSSDSGTDLSRNAQSVSGTRDLTEKVYVRTDSGRETVRTESGTETVTEEGTPKSGTDCSPWSAVSDTPSISGSATGFTRSGNSVSVSPNYTESGRSVTYFASNNGATSSVTISQIGLASVEVSASASVIYYGQSTTVSVKANYTDGSSEDVTALSVISVAGADAYTSLSGSTFTHNKLYQTSDVELNGTATFGGRTVSFSFIIGRRHYSAIEMTSITNGSKTIKPGFRVRWNDTGEWDSKTNAACDRWLVGGEELSPGNEAEAAYYNGFYGQIVILYTNQIGVELKDGRLVWTENGKWYFN